MKPEELKALAVDALEGLKAIDITVIDVHEITSITDYMIICSGSSSQHIHSIADNVAMQAKKQGQQPLGIEGKNSNDWVLVDLGDVVVHVMLPETREFYDLEKLWDQA